MIRQFSRRARPGQSTSYATSDDALDKDSEDGITEDKTLEEYGSRTLRDVSEEDNEEGIHRLRQARDAIEQDDHDRSIDFPLHPSNNLDIEERVAATPLAQDPDDYPIYDLKEEDEADRMEEACKISGWHYRGLVLKHRLFLAGDYLIRCLIAIMPRPQATPIPSREGGMALLVPDQIEAKRFKAPKGKRWSPFSSLAPLPID